MVKSTAYFIMFFDVSGTFIITGITLALIIMMLTLHCAHKKSVYYVVSQFARALNVEIL